MTATPEEARAANADLRAMMGERGNYFAEIEKAAAEALAIGKEFGLDPAVMLDVVNTSTGRSFTSEVVFTGDVITGRYGTGFALGLLAKDVGIAAGLAESVGISAPALDLVQRRWAEAAAGLGFAADHSAAHKQWLPTDLTSGD